MGARIRSGLIITAFIAFWALLLRALVGLVKGPPLDWTFVAHQIAGALPWVLSFTVLYAIYRGWIWLVANLRRLATAVRQGLRRGP